MEEKGMRLEMYDVSDYRRLEFLSDNVRDVLTIVLENVKAGIGLFEVTLSSVRALYLNQAFFTCIGFTQEGYARYANNIFSTLLPEYAKGFSACIRENAPQGKDICYTVCGKRQDESIGWFEIKGVAIQNALNDHPIYLTVITDITDSKEKEQKLAELRRVNDELMMHEERYRVLSATSQGILFEYFPDTDTMMFSYNLPHNHKTKKVTDYKEHLAQKPMVHSDHIQMFTRALKTALKQDTEGEIEYLSTVSGGGYRWHSTFYKSILRSDGTVGSVAGRITDIHEEKLKREKMNYQAQVDGLTGLYRKEAAFDMMREYIVESPESEFYFILLDLDDFKRINDQYGHKYGDKMLRNTAEKMLSYFTEDCIVGRFGGDEFIIMTKNISIEEIKQRLFALISAIPCSVGIVPWKFGMSSEDVFDWADANMYEAKRDKNSADHPICIAKVTFQPEHQSRF